MCTKARHVYPHRGDDTDGCVERDGRPLDLVLGGVEPDVRSPRKVGAGQIGLMKLASVKVRTGEVGCVWGPISVRFLLAKGQVRP